MPFRFSVYMKKTYQSLRLLQFTFVFDSFACQNESVAKAARARSGQKQ